MYKKILVPLENSTSDQVILAHIRPFLKMTGAEVVLVHVADGYAARLQEELNLQDSEEIKKDREYLDDRKSEFSREGFKVKSILVGGEPSVKIIGVAENEGCDLIAMATHGHRLIKDIVYGTVAESIRHRTSIPILMVRDPNPST